MMRKQVQALLAVLAIYCLGSSSIANGAEFSCQDRVLFDYGRALAPLPDNHLPRDGELDFGPRDLTFRAGESIVVRGEHISYELFLDRFLSERQHSISPATLNWKIELDLVAVDHLGRLVGNSIRRRWLLRKLRLPEWRLGIPAEKSGLHRATLRIGQIGGPVLGTFRQFIKVLPLRERFTVAIKGSRSVHSGQTLTARIENRGTPKAIVPVGGSLTLERRDGGTWEEVKGDTSASGTYEDPELLPGGRAGPCSFWRMPVSAAPGPYRLSGEIESKFGSRRRIHAHFNVLNDLRSGN